MDTPNEQGNIEPIGEFLHKYKVQHNDFPVPHYVVEHEKFIAYKASIKVVYFYLAHLANRFAKDDGWFFKSRRNLSKLMGLDIKTIKEAIKQLVKDGFIQFKDGGYDPSSRIRQAGLYRVWGGEKLSQQKSDEPIIDNQYQPESEPDYEDDDDRI